MSRWPLRFREGLTKTSADLWSCYALERPWITGINFQPATYSGRYYLPEDIEQRITFPDVVRYVCEQTDGLVST